MSPFLVASISTPVSRRFVTRTTLKFRQEEFILNGEVKVIFNEQNAYYSVPASVRRTERVLEIYRD